MSIGTRQEDFWRDEYYEEARAPWPLLAMAGFSVALSVALLPFTTFMSHVAGYLTGSLVCIGLVAGFIRTDTRRRQDRVVEYIEVRGLSVAWGVILALGIAIASVHLWYVATELAVVR